MNIKQAKEKWHIKSDSTIRKWCSAGDIIGAKLINNKWYIPDDSIRPLRKNDIKGFLITIMLLKNNPMLYPDFSIYNISTHDLNAVLAWLEYKQYLYKKQASEVLNLKNIIISAKGIEIIFNRQMSQLQINNIMDIGCAIIQFATGIVNLIKI